MQISETTPLGSKILAETLPLILMIDDADSDIELMQEALRSCGIGVRMVAASTTREALGALRLLASNVMPRLIILDLGLPGQRGDVILGEFVVNPAWKDIPILVLTGSERETDRIQSLARGAKEYVVKPDGFSGYQELAQHLRTYLQD
jgi:CheY-like chemotaxis protein